MLKLGFQYFMSYNCPFPVLVDFDDLPKVPKRDAPIITIHGIMSDKSMMYKNFLKSNKLKIN